MAEVFTRFGREAAEDDGWRPDHVHIVNASYLIGGQSVPSSSSMFWRGRIDRVDGWSFGSMSTS